MGSNELYCIILLQYISEIFYCVKFGYPFEPQRQISSCFTSHFLINWKSGKSPVSRSTRVKHFLVWFMKKLCLFCVFSIKIICSPSWHNNCCIVHSIRVKTFNEKGVIASLVDHNTQNIDLHFCPFGRRLIMSTLPDFAVAAPDVLVSRLVK